MFFLIFFNFYQNNCCIPLLIVYNTKGGINVDLLVVPLVAFVVFSSSSSSYHESSSGLFFSPKKTAPEILYAYPGFSFSTIRVFVASTGEAPGTNRLEICGEKGKIVLEGNTVRFTRNEVPCSEFQKTSKNPMAKPDVCQIDIDVEDPEDQHAEVTKNFANAILTGEKLIAPAAEGINSVELANAILYSSLIGKPVDLPLNAQIYEAKLLELINNS